MADTIKEKAIKVIIEQEMPEVSFCELDGTYMVKDGNKLFMSRESAEEDAKKEFKLLLLANLADVFELDWGYDGKKITIKL